MVRAYNNGASETRDYNQALYLDALISVMSVRAQDFTGQTHLQVSPRRRHLSFSFDLSTRCGSGRQSVSHSQQQPGSVSISDAAGGALTDTGQVSCTNNKFMDGLGSEVREREEEQGNRREKTSQMEGRNKRKGDRMKVGERRELFSPVFSLNNSLRNINWDRILHLGYRTVLYDVL